MTPGARGGDAHRSWYQDFFGEEFWAVAAHEYTAERTTAEADYLADVLDASAPGRRVLDLGCGTGRHAMALAGRGFRVTGVDVGAWALRQAAQSAAAAGVEVEWLHLDLLREQSWPVGEFDAIVCVQSFGWGSDAQQLRLLREARRALVPGGLLVLDHSNVLTIASHYVPEATFETEGLLAVFRRDYRVVCGRSTGSIEVRRGDAEPVIVHDDVRLYQPAEVRDLLVRAGFEIERADADFTVGRQAALTTRYVQFVARNPQAADTTAIKRWEEPPAGRRTEPAAPGPADAVVPGDLVDLRWSPDEIDFVQPSVDRAFRTVSSGVARAYHVTDPYAAAQAAPVLSEHFGLELPPDTVTAGTGATGLLHACAALAQPGPVLYLSGGHPDLPRWAARLGSEAIVTRPGNLTADLDRHAPSVLVLDRPTIAGDLYGRETLDEIARAARARGTTVVLDEAYAVYAGPDASCVPAVAEHDNLIVLRSMSKGYCCGGLRVGFAVAAPVLTGRLREVLPPLGASGFGLTVALRLLAQGDIFAGLRARIAEVKPEVTTLLRGAGLAVTEGDTCLPWVTAPAHDAGRAVLERFGLRVKEVQGQDMQGSGRQVASRRPRDAGGADRELSDAEGSGSIFKISVPLSDARLTAFRAAFTRGGLHA
ncbi:aminotransferase class I/II-fold pyridoxal phosphate-dependent enzyme [Streptomyces sp. NRRL B-24085]|uniref:aminotransferase class I/II-fold pyridoxal phosphate-dependent enzyme n=1 Tax=Streptomyces sp. NRRL B-24085 TaxID=1709476 RepID=UPI000A38B7FE|nr:aminotransferase class I/II-fold pyridoxal phosphate-dependent enzyme [Streptomyces sp. NRRL B-24085]